jgi:hypothetical protein
VFRQELQPPFGYVVDFNEQTGRSIRHYLAYKKIIQDNESYFYKREILLLKEISKNERNLDHGRNPCGNYEAKS